MDSGTRFPARDAPAARNEGEFRALGGYANGMARDDHARHPEPERRKPSRDEYARGLWDYHDPLAGFGGKQPALSALTLRLWLAGFGFVFCTAMAVVLLLYLAPLTWLAVVLAILAVVAAVDFGWVAYRKRRGEPG